MTITELESFFANTPVPSKIQLTEHEFIEDTGLFISTHLNILKSNPKNKRFMPYFNRLVRLATKVDEQ